MGLARHASTAMSTLRCAGAVCARLGRPRHRARTMPATLQRRSWVPARCEDLVQQIAAATARGAPAALDAELHALVAASLGHPGDKVEMGLRAIERIEVMRRLGGARESLRLHGHLPAGRHDHRAAGADRPPRHAPRGRRRGPLWPRHRAGAGACRRLHGRCRCAARAGARAAAELGALIAAALRADDAASLAGDGRRSGGASAACATCAVEGAVEHAR